MPTFQGMAQQAGVPRVAASIPTVAAFRNGDNAIYEWPYAITGVTRNSAGAVLAGCRVELFRTIDDSPVSQTTSDASGNYVVPASNLLQHYVVAYKAGSPDVCGSSVNTLTGA